MPRSSLAARRHCRRRRDARSGDRRRLLPHESGRTRSDADGAKLAGIGVSPDGFLGLSTEYRGLEAYVGTNPAALDQPFLRLVRSLSPGQSPVFRLGGDSTDWTWWPVKGMRAPGGVKYDLGPGWARVARAFAAGIGGRLILGINFEADSGTVASTEARELAGRLGPRAIAGSNSATSPSCTRASAGIAPRTACRCSDALGLHVPELCRRLREDRCIAPAGCARRAELRLRRVPRSPRGVSERRAPSRCRDRPRLPPQALHAHRPSDRCRAARPGFAERARRPDRRVRVGRPPPSVDIPRRRDELGLVWWLAGRDGNVRARSVVAQGAVRP